MKSPTSRPTHWQLRTQALRLPAVGEPSLLMGIVNVTPDSFSDGGLHDEIEAAVKHGLALAAAGADIIDVGGESTRPFAEPVSAEEEWQRVGEVIEQLAEQVNLPISIDTSKAVVAERAISAGAEIINDITGLEGDPEMADLARSTAVGVCAMHMQGTPQTMQIDPKYASVVEDIHAYLRLRRDALLDAGIAHESICLDPGIGFGKTHEHNLILMQQASHFLDLGCPILIGHSRKGFLGKIVEQVYGRKPTHTEIDLVTATTACNLATQGIQLIRVHNIATVRLALASSMATS